MERVFVILFILKLQIDYLIASIYFEKTDMMQSKFLPRKKISVDPILEKGREISFEMIVILLHLYYDFYQNLVVDRRTRVDRCLSQIVLKPTLSALGVDSYKSSICSGVRQKAEKKTQKH